ncbi:MAG: 5'-nucleotidase, lipoprotein e(P4) family [Spirochaetaceae bacterium]|jgi:5'-nucleotidase (lipoprotein e(P4) family)|nr:5'-nucleotidase, lipoprotein e(P4) family [Spirochaetaceae bacterium]
MRKNLLRLLPAERSAVFRRFIYGCLAAAVFTSCAPKTGGQGAARRVLENQGQRDMAMAILWQQHSGEYAALCYQAFNAGRAYVQEAEAGVKYAVIFDIDETVLDNSPYDAYLIYENAAFDEKSWEEWCNAESAEAVPGALEFCAFLVKNDIEIFYISNRPESVLVSTMNNLNMLGFPNARAGRVLLKTDTSDKTPRVKSVREAGYTILISAGDNLDDFDSSIRKYNNAARRDWAAENAETFGQHRLILPNPVYGTFESVFIENYHSKSHAERAVARLNLLKSWK